MRLRSLPQFKRNAIRFEQIVRVFAKYGLAAWLKESDPKFLQRLIVSSGGERLTGRTRPERIRMALAELGTTFIKLGQMLSTRPDLIGDDLAAELSKLQTDAPADSLEAVRETIESDLGRPMEDLFADFDDVCIASASIAQVHEAVLNDGVEVVVKVQHADIENRILDDLEILRGLAGLAERYSKDLRLSQPVRIVEEFRRMILRELDFGLEEQNLLQFQRNFEDDETVCFPSPFPDLSSKRVLTMERIEGISLLEAGQKTKEGLDTAELAKRGINVFLKMIFGDGFYHADPHPGNIVILTDNVIGILDCGMVGYVDQLTREDIEGLLDGFLTKDSALLTDSALRLGLPPKDIDREELQGRLEILVQDHLSGPLRDLNLGMILEGLIEIIRQHRIMLKPGIARLMKVLVMLEGTGRMLHPEFSLYQALEPYYRQMVRRRFSPQNIIHRIRRSYQDWDQVFRVLPRDLVELLRQARKGTLDVHLQHRRLDAVANRLALSVLTAAIFLGSTQLWSQRIPPLLAGTSVPGLLGTLISVYLGVVLLRSIRKSGGTEKGE